jgi:rhodanese-related sulfurtransferase
VQDNLLVAAATSDVPEISREEVRRRLNDASLTILDVLPAESYVARHIPRALNLPVQSIASRASDVLPDHLAEIVVYCGKFT